MYRPSPALDKGEGSRLPWGSVPQKVVGPGWRGDEFLVWPSASDANSVGPKSTPPSLRLEVQYA